MTVRKLSITAVLAAAVVAGHGYADMTPLSGLETRCGETPSCHEATDCRHMDTSGLLDPGSLLDLDFSSIGRSSLALEHAGDIRRFEAGCLHVMAREPGSIAFCIYALLSLGLYRSVPSIRKLPLSQLPEWRHSSAAHQSDCMRAGMPVFLRSASVCLLPPPDGTADDSLPQYHLKATISLWRKAQLAWTVLVPRGPPAG